MSVPAFIDLEEGDQVAELRAYLKSKGADIEEENSPEGFVRDVYQVLEAADVLWKDGSEQECEAIYNSIISILLVIPPDHINAAVDKVCSKLTQQVEKGDRRGPVRLRLLNNLFHGLDERSEVRFLVYSCMVQLAHQADIMSLLNPELTEIKKYIAQWDISAMKIQGLLRNLHDAFLDSKQSDKATKVMIELLGSYTETDASQARDDAHRCIVTHIADPNTYLMDHLLSLKPVKFLEGELIHDLLTIFVSGRLSQYLQFYEANKDFINSLKLSHEQNMFKMQMLTFMSLSETNSEIDFDMIQRELQIPEEDVEAFIIDVVRTRSVRAKIDQMSRKVIVSSTTHRTFGKQHWQLLRDSFEMWQFQLNQVLGNLSSLPTQ